MNLVEDILSPRASFHLCSAQKTPSYSDVKRSGGVKVFSTSEKSSLELSKAILSCSLLAIHLTKVARMDSGHEGALVVWGAP